MLGNLCWVKKIYAGCAELNEASIKVLKKNGFVLEGERKDHLYYNGKYMKQLDFGLISNWFNSINHVFDNVNIFNSHIPSETAILEKAISNQQKHVC